MDLVTIGVSVRLEISDILFNHDFAVFDQSIAIYPGKYNTHQFQKQPLQHNRPHRTF